MLRVLAGQQQWSGGCATWQHPPAGSDSSTATSARPAILQCRSPLHLHLSACPHYPCWPYVRACAGIIRRAAEHILAHVAAVKEKLKPGEAISIRAYGLELYNEELRDLSSKAAAAAAAAAAANGDDAGSGSGSSSVRLSERPLGNGRCVPEVSSRQAAGVEG